MGRKSEPSEVLQRRDQDQICGSRLVVLVRLRSRLITRFARQGEYLILSLQYSSTIKPIEAHSVLSSSTETLAKEDC